MPSTKPAAPALEAIEAHYAHSPFVREICVLVVPHPDDAAHERLHAVVVPDDDRLRKRRIVNIRDLIRFELETLSVTLPPDRRVQGFDVSLRPLPRSPAGFVLRDEVARHWRERCRGVAWTHAGPPEPDAPADDALTRAVLHAIRARAPQARVTTSSHLDLDVGLDSMRRVELMLDLEARFGCGFDADTSSRIATVEDLVDTLRAAGARADRESPAMGSVWDRRLDAPPLHDPDVPEFERPKRLLAAAAFATLKVLALVLRMTIGLRVRGTQHLPHAGPYLLCPNHQSFVDGFLICTGLPFRALRSIFIVGAPEYFSTPATAWLARAINLVPVDPDANLVRALQIAAAGLRLGRVLMIFPEGERSIDGALKLFREGGPLLASHLGVPIVPVALDGAFELWPRGRGINWRLLLPFSGHRVGVLIGTPFVPGEHGAPGSAPGVALHLRERVGALLAELRAGR